MYMYPSSRYKTAQMPWKIRSSSWENLTHSEAVLGRFVCFALRFIPHGPRKKTLIPYLQCFEQ